MAGHTRWVSCVQFSTTSPSRIYSSSDDGSIALWQINDTGLGFEIDNKPLALKYPTNQGVYSLQEVNDNILTSYKVSIKKEPLIYLILIGLHQDGTLRQHTVTGCSIHSERTLHGYHNSVAKCVRARDSEAHIFASCGNDKLISILYMIVIPLLH